MPLSLRAELTRDTMPAITGAEAEVPDTIPHQRHSRKEDTKTVMKEL